MSTPFSRRSFVASGLAAGTLASLGDFAFLGGLPHLAGDTTRVTPKTVQLSPDIEPLVRLIEDTERDKLLGVVAERIRKGTTYQQLLSAVFLAGVRGIQPRPVGFKFHAVLVISSAHLATMAAPDNDRWLPLIWAIDNFKKSQAANKEQGDWHMAAVDEAKLPPAREAKKRFIEAMDSWDVEGADRAVAALARTASAGEIAELFYRYGCRDFRDIGHKAIYVANGFRTLQTIGWQHAEPFLRSLAYALLEHEGGNPAQRDADPDRPGRKNLERVPKMKPLAQAARHSKEAATDLLAALRTATAEEGSAKAADLIDRGISADSVWDGLFLTAGELLMRQPGIVGIHCVTSANALHYAYQHTASDETRRLLTLQCAAFLPMFRQFMERRGKLSDTRIDQLEKGEVAAEAPKAIEDIFATVSKSKLEAARKTLAFLSKEPGQVPALMTAARRLIFSKGNDSHDYKFSSAALEDYYFVAPAWRNAYAAASMFHLHGSGDRDNQLIRQARTTLKG